MDRVAWSEDVSDRVSRSSPGTGPGPVLGPGQDCQGTGPAGGSQRFGPGSSPGPAMRLTSADRMGPSRTGQDRAPKGPIDTALRADFE